MIRARRSLRSIRSKAIIVLRAAQAGNIPRVSLVATILAICAFAGAPARSAAANRAPDFLVHGNVFDDRGFTVANARIRISPAGETKWRWETVSDSQGEFALHVPAGAQYVLRVDAKGYQALTQNVDASQDIRADLSLHLAARGGGKSG